jgi:AraC-like DNA-binding protein
MFSEELSTKAMLFFVLYGITAAIPLIASAYLLLRRANAIAPSVTSPVRLRRWTASFFAVATLAHVWWLLFYIFSGDPHSVSCAVLSMVDCVLLFVTFVGMLFAMLQDRRRPVWPALAAMLPFVLLGTAYIVFSNSLLVKMASIYLLLLGLAFTGNMVYAIRQYERWLNDNYADLENKKVWLCLTVSLVCMLMFILYVFADDMTLIWLVHFVELLLVGLLLWRVETLPNLETHPQPLPEMEGSEYSQSGAVADELSTPLPHREGQGGGSLVDLAQIEQLLNELCVAPQLYLQHDLSRQDLAHAVGTNRSYLSQYFSRQGITYYTYINNLRINYFVKHYKEGVAAGEPVKVQQLANESGFSTYRTFSRAFTERMGMSVTEWMQETEK